jgi:hypothetical protein
VVIIQPTPDIEHKSFVNDAEQAEPEESDLPPPLPVEPEAEGDDQQDELENEDSDDLPPPPDTEVESSVEINVFESGPQRTSFSSEEGERDEERSSEPTVPSESCETKSQEEVKEVDSDLTSPETVLIKSEEEKEPLPQPTTEVPFEVDFEAEFEANFNDDDGMPLPPPPVDKPAESPLCNDEEDEEDEQLIMKKLKQLKDDNNNFTSSFEQLDQEKPIVLPATQASFANFDANFESQDDLK